MLADVASRCALRMMPTTHCRSALLKVFAGDDPE
jgi:hypothetical protein